MPEVQAILFKKKYYSTKRARKWLKDNNFRAIKRVHKTNEFLRYRLRKPSKKRKYRVKNFSKTIKAIIEY